jgi:hypothetical protein
MHAQPTDPHQVTARSSELEQKEAGGGAYHSGFLCCQWVVAGAGSEFDVPRAEGRIRRKSMDLAALVEADAERLLTCLLMMP